MPTSPGPMLATLDALWQRIRADVPGLPPIRPTVSPTKSRQDHGPHRWTKEDDGAVTGLVVTVDLLQAGPEAVLEHVVHEAAHVLNWTRGIADTTMRGVYHNAHFVAAAEEVGLEWPDGSQRMAGRGYFNPVLSSASKQRHEPDLRALREAIPAILPHMDLPASSGRTDRLTLVCSCDPPRRLRIARTVAAQGPVICGVCRHEFAEE